MGTCGDGALDPGEECDDGTKCCDQSTCRLAPNARCSPLSGSAECCDDECGFQIAEVSCDGGAGYCSRGKCETNIAYCDMDADFTTDTGACPIGAADPGNVR